MSGDASSSSNDFRPLTLPPGTVRESEDFDSASDSDSGVMIGRVLKGRYELRDVIGRGGMGMVYGGVDHKHGRNVAVKVLRQNAMTRDNYNRFKREVAAARAVRHEAVCRVFACGVQDAVPFIVMERLTGVSLRTHLKEHGALSVPNAVSVTLQLLDALGAVHAANILHRDVKPANVLLLGSLEAQPRLKLIDFGLVRPRFDSESGTRITVTGVMPGTPAYLSPEQICGMNRLDDRIDVWGAGIVFYEALTASHPFAVWDFETLVRRITTEPTPPLAHVRTDVPADIEAVLGRALAKRREDRFRTVGEFQRALASAWAGHRLAAMQRGTRMVKGVRPSLPAMEAVVMPPPSEVVMPPPSEDVIPPDLDEGKDFVTIEIPDVFDDEAVTLVKKDRPPLRE